MGQTIKTSIDGLTIIRNKFLKDRRGVLYELVPGGTRHKLILTPSIGNIYISKATRKYVPRAGHFHKKLVERFATLTGSVLWHFEDLRKKSKTYGETFALTCGEKPNLHLRGLLDLPMSREGIPLIVVPPGVYHLYFPLTNSPAIVLAIASTPYEPEDYFDPIPNKSSILRRYLGGYGG